MKLRLGKTRVYIGYEAVAAMTAVLLLDKENRIICCFLAALLHESGHLLMMKLCGLSVNGVKLRLFDIMIESPSPRTLRDDVLITVGGPLINLMLFAVMFSFSEKLSTPHLVLGLFNLLPIMSLDGGHLLEIILLKKYSHQKTTLILRLSTFISILPLMTGGIFVLLKSGYNYSLLAISLYLLAVLLFKK